MKNKNRILMHVSVMFMVFSVIVLVICGISTYNIQTKIQSAQLIKNITDVPEYIRLMMEEDEEEFVFFQEYILAHPESLRITQDVSDWAEAEKEFEEAFHSEYPGMTLGVDMDYRDMTDELQQLCVVYNYKYWMHMILEAMEKYEIEYTYYITPLDDGSDSILYTLDIAADSFEENGIEYRVFGTKYYEDPAEHKNLWETWKTGKTTGGFDEYNNEYGHTYVYYVPLFINGQKLGMIGSEIMVDSFNRGILDNTLRQIIFIALIFIAGELVLLWVINKRYISRIDHMSKSVKAYTDNKDVSAADEINGDNKGNDELSYLAGQTSSMIREIDRYVTFLRSMTIELSETKQEAADMNKLATKDALTGIRNKTAYDEEMGHLALMMEGGLRDFGIAMVDLNYLKRINDTYGHEKGNISIVTVCKIVCTVFEHSPVFRIGGDEFAIILTGHDFEHIAKLTERFKETLEGLKHNKDLEEWEAVSASIGYALYDPEKDSGVDSVFKRADAAMYDNKKKMHAERA